MEKIQLTEQIFVFRQPFIVYFLLERKKNFYGE